ncbi:P-loop containing nucleoside triphosphate hydrolase protein [Hypoxylon sp. FL1284]|nr:P-loop containing nucleoside triphosphate hydrolase protein [Hypoxylon sp. FL1284]
MASDASPKSFGNRLPQFFQDGYSLVQGDLNLLERTITELATEQGSLAIREMVDEHVLYCRTELQRIDTWRNCIRPFFQILTEPRVARSKILEVHTATIYNAVLGSDAGRLEMLFNFILDLAARTEVCEFLEICTQVLVGVVDTIAKDPASPIIHRIIGRMKKCLESLDEEDRTFWSLQAKKNLELAQRLLEEAEYVEAAPKSPVPLPAIDSPQRDLPGKLSPYGPRHDNDSEDISEIKILPTTSEINSMRKEYLPVHDVTQLHLPGVQGLIDRHFRLLREDTVGPLKKRINDELHALRDSDINVSQQQAGLRTYSYNVVDILDVTCTRRGGLEFHLKLDQPLPVRDLSAQAREDWWDISRRLEIGALVCFLHKDTSIFCVVSESTKRPESTREHSAAPWRQVTERRDLYSSQDFAYVSLAIAEPTSANLVWFAIQTLLLKQLDQQSLVEFPGVLLPSFQHTLSALQSMSKSADLPFSEFLAPSVDRSLENTIPVPSYAIRPGFEYNLKCLTSDGKDFLYSPRDEPDPHALCRRSSLDFGQATALLNALGRSLALIQGPPGTGKSYTGEAIAKVLLANKKQAKAGPILCVCYTNHALDQLLEHLWDGGAKQIIRIGSRSKSEIVAKLSLRHIGMNAKRTKAERKFSWETSRALQQAEISMRKYLGELSLDMVAEKIKEKIETQAPRFHDAIFGTEDENQTITSREEAHAPVMRWFATGTETKTESSLRSTKSLSENDPMTLSRNERSLEEELAYLHDTFLDAKKKFATAVGEVDLRLLEGADIIGATTTGLAKNLELLRRLDSKVLICEEAGEVLESHILTALLPSVEHAILIVDHLQLRPQIVNYELSASNPHGKQYSFDVSLFERLVQTSRPTDMRLPFDTLEMQRRMHPSISDLIRDTSYDYLQDSQVVKNYPEVVGMRHRLFWFDHDEPEADAGPTSTSKTNEFEVDMVCALVSHLVRQGVYRRDDIAVLTPYLSQLHKLRRKLQNSFEVIVDESDLEELHNDGWGATTRVYEKPLGRQVRLATVDNFQGEEADVVIVSLVRSNPGRQCGFLKTTNRMNVLLSRAKHGMYIFGNSSTYESVENWADVIDMLKRDGNFGTKLPLQCPRHEAKSIEVSSPHDFFRLSPEAGCDQECLLPLECGHACLEKCHAAPLHKVAKCLAPCPRIEKACGHSCSNLCGEPCEEQCSTILEGESIQLPCGHSLISPTCSQAERPEDVKCEHPVTRIVPGCNHSIEAACCEEISTDSLCKAKCKELLPCGHACERTCATCKITVRGKIIREEHRFCIATCGRKYDTCNHHCIERCHPGKSCPPCNLPCQVQCPHSRCFKKCSETCSRCPETECASGCPHSMCSRPCAAPCDWVPCSRRCQELLSCGHQCPSLCGELCPGDEYCHICASPEVKATSVDMNGTTYGDVNIDVDPCVFMRCGHFMTRSSMDRHLGIADYYEVVSEGGHEVPVAVRSSAGPFLDPHTKCCPFCKGSLRDIGRYGRIVRQIVLNDSAKSFGLAIVHAWLAKNVSSLVRSAIPEDIQIIGNPLQQLVTINNWNGLNQCLLPLIKHYLSMTRYLHRVRDQEQSYQSAYNTIQHDGETNHASPDLGGLRTRAQLLAGIVRMRCYLAGVDIFMDLKRRSQPRAIYLNVDAVLEECDTIVNLAQVAKYPCQEMEGRMFFAKVVAISRMVDDTNDSTQDIYDDRTLPKSVIAAKSHLWDAEMLRGRYLLDTKAREEFEVAVNMLHDGSPYRRSMYKKRDIWTAVAEEFRDTGRRWYACVEGHPFTLAADTVEIRMEEVKCPECLGAVALHEDYKGEEAL